MRFYRYEIFRRNYVTIGQFAETVLAMGKRDAESLPLIACMALYTQTIHG